MNKWKRRCRCCGWGLGLAAVLASAAGCGLFPKEENPLPPPLAKPVEIQLNTVPVKRGDIVKTFQSSGTFEAKQHTYEQFTESGLRVKSVDVMSGDKVRKGQVLIQLQDHDLGLQLEEKQLVYDQAVLDYHDAGKSMDKAHQYIKKETINIAKKKLDQIKHEIGVRTLRAVTGGVVTFVMDIEPGDAVPAYEPVVGIADPIGLRIAVDSGSGSDVSVGMEAVIEYNGKSFTGTVVQTPGSAPYTKDKRLAGEYAKTLYIQPDKPIPGAGIGTYADIKIVIRRKQNTLMIPRAGLRSYMDRTYVQVLDGSSRREIDVKTGLKTSTEVEILQGLKEGQQVILQ